MPSQSGGIYNNDRETIRSNHAIINGDRCTIYGNHCVINGDHCTIYGNHNVINGDYCQVKSGSHNILNGSRCSDQGNYNIHHNSNSNFSNIIINNDIDPSNWNQIISDSTVRLGSGIGNMLGTSHINWSGDGMTITTNSAGTTQISGGNASTQINWNNNSSRRRRRSPKPEPQPEPEPFSLLFLEGEAEETENEREQCIICMDHKKDILFQPCKHCCCCVNCARQLGDDQSPKCPQCRVVVTFAEKIFF